MPSSSFDPLWEARYRENPLYRNRYPWSQVVSFVFRHTPDPAERRRTRLLEVGCGNGANLWFAAREGLMVSGIDGSETAIADAHAWFAREGLAGDFRVGDFAALPFAAEAFDIAIDRAALAHVCLPALRRAIAETWRVLRLGGHLLFSPYSDRCTSCQGPPDADGCHHTKPGGTLAPGQRVTFLGEGGIRELLADGWIIEHMAHTEDVELKGAERLTHAEWRVEATKVARAGR